ncbi:unnamed protein product [Symbiodinium natans]|uniref:Uncharacterized protein n=1 Tax=Symbiodinium natans TaxID=878477 RepID=A0A812TQV9_9DINO|nr:unnamed protein product [Symbiodinium natans]
MAEDEPAPVATEPAVAEPPMVEPFEPAEPAAVAEPPTEAPQQAPQPKRRGRPPGSKNKPKPPPTVAVAELPKHAPERPSDEPPAPEPQQEPRQERAEEPEPPQPVRMTPSEARRARQLSRRNAASLPQAVPQNLTPLLYKRQQQLIDARAFNEWLANRRQRQEGEAYADELGRMTDAVNRRIPQLRPSYGQVLGYIAEGEPLPINLPNRNASILTSSHFWLDDYPQSSEPEPAPLPHTTVDPAAAFEDTNEGYDGVPFPRRDFLRPRPFDVDSESDFGAVDPGQALRNDGLEPPAPPSFLSRLQQAEAAAGAAAGLAGSASAIAGHGQDLYNAARRGRNWIDRNLRIPRTPEGLAPPPDEVAPPQIIGRPSEVEPLLERAGQRAQEVERAAARDIEQFMSEQVAEAEATEGFASTAEMAAGAAEAAAAAEGPSALALFGEAGRPHSWEPLHGGMVAAEHLMGWGGGGGTDTDASRPSSAPDIQTLNGMQEFGAEQHFQVREPQASRQRPRTEFYRLDTESESEPRAQPPPRVQARPARPTRFPTGLNPAPLAQSSGSDSSRGPRMQRPSRAAPPPSFEALRSASEPEAA